MKILELARRLKIPSKELLIQVVKLGIAVKSAQASISDEEIKKVVEVLSKKNPAIKMEEVGQISPPDKKGRRLVAEPKEKKTKAKAQKQEAEKKSKPAKKILQEKKAQPLKPEDIAAKPKARAKKIKEEPLKPGKEATAEPKTEAKAEAKIETKVKAEVSIKEQPRTTQPMAPAGLKPTPPPAAAVLLKGLQLKFPLSIKELAEKMSVGASSVIKALMDMRILATINQLIDEKDAAEVAVKFGYDLKRLPTAEEESMAVHQKEEERKEDLLPRPPIVTLMGHVDHGKTSLLDYIRKSKVVDQEKGGITQHIGAYEVNLNKGKITFLDTPGHEAFTAMRARGANATDIVVLVVAADDGVMPQTIEALDHARAAEVPVIVAINKIDKPDIDLDRVKKQLADIDLLAEDWGGKTVTVKVSAKTGQGVDELLEMIVLEAELLELKANPNKPARGVVIEGKVSKGGGPIATVLVQSGTLRHGDVIIAGQYYGKIRALINDRIHRIKEALPSMPVEILGLNGAPLAGNTFMVVEDEKRAREICDMRRQKIDEERTASAAHRITLEDLYSEIQKGKIKELKIILKADVTGSSEAMADSLTKLSTKDITLNIIHKGIGDVNESDILLAAASNAIILGFHVRKTPEADRAAKAENVDIRLYGIIYEGISDIKAAMEGMLEPHIKEVFMGKILVRQVFKVTKAGIIAGSVVQKGKAIRNANCRLIRNGQEAYKGKLSSLKRFKDDVREVAEGFECGIALDNFQDIQAGDIIEVFSEEKIARKL